MSRLRRIVAKFFPPPRTSVRWSEAVPLAIFAVLFVVGCLALEFGQVLMFGRPLMLGLAILAPWFWWMHVAGFGGLP